jgi:hypothetical protein
MAYAVQALSSDSLNNQHVREDLQQANKMSGWALDSEGNVVRGHEISGKIGTGRDGSLGTRWGYDPKMPVNHSHNYQPDAQGNYDGLHVKEGFHTHPPPPKWGSYPSGSLSDPQHQGDVWVAKTNGYREVVVSESEVWEATASGQKNYLGTREDALGVGHAIDVWAPAVSSVQAAMDAQSWCDRTPGCH